MKRYRVFRISRTRHLSGPDTVLTWGHRDFNWKWTSRVYMWFNTGSSILGVTQYIAERTERVYLDPEPWASFDGDTGYATMRYPVQPAAFLPPYIHAELKPRPQYYQTPEYYDHTRYDHAQRLEEARRA